MRTRLRIVALGLLLGAIFIWLTSGSRWSLRSLTEPFLRRAASWSEPVTVKGAGLSPDEQNNIDIYKSSHMATVSITSEMPIQITTQNNAGMPVAAAIFAASVAWLVPAEIKKRSFKLKNALSRH